MSSLLDVPARFERAQTVRESCSAGLFGLFVCAAVLSPWLVVWCLLSDVPGWPLNDDPFYAKPLEFWSQNGRVQLVRQYGYLTASSVAHIATGLLASFNGLSFRQLYLVCIAQQAAGAVALYWFARRLQLSRPIAIIAAASLVAYPLYFGHAFTFMTDGPAAGWASLACVALSIGLIERNRRWLVVGALAVGWGYWIRQTNGALLIAPCALLAAMWFKPGSRVSLALTWPLSLALLMIIALESGWALPASTARLGDIAPQPTEGYWKRTLIALYGWLLLAGWYSLPLAPWLIAQAWRCSRHCDKAVRYGSHLCASLTLLAGAVPFVATAGRAHITSATGSFIQNGHFGPIFLSDMDEPGRWGTLAGVQWPEWVWQLLSLLAIASAAAIAWWASWTIIQTLRHWTVPSPRPLLENASAWLLMVVVTIAALAFLVEPHLDRYWLFMMPVLTVICLSLAAEHRWQIGRLSMAWASGWIALQLFLTTFFVHDMLVWNNARWQFVESHLAAGHAAQSIDAGRDVNAWLRMNEDPYTSARPGDDSRWWSGHASFCIASGPRPGWQLHSQLPWHSWATGRTHFLLVLERSLPNG